MCSLIICLILVILFITDISWYLIGLLIQFIIYNLKKYTHSPSPPPSLDITLLDNGFSRIKYKKRKGHYTNSTLSIMGIARTSPNILSLLPFSTDHNEALIHHFFLESWILKKKNTCTNVVTLHLVTIKKKKKLTPHTYLILGVWCTMFFRIKPNIKIEKLSIHGLLVRPVVEP